MIPWNFHLLFKRHLDPFRPLESHRYEIVAVRALQFNGIALPPGQASPKLEGGQAGKDIVIKETTKPARIVTAYLKRLSHLVPGAAVPFHSTDGGPDLITDTWISCHGH
jgi:hypothetical protein